MATAAKTARTVPGRSFHDRDDATGILKYMDVQTSVEML